MVSDDDFELVFEDADESAPEAQLLAPAELKKPGYYVVFDKNTGSIKSIDHQSKHSLTNGFGELFLQDSDELDRLFDNRLNIDKLHVKFDLATKNYILIVRKYFNDVFVHEFTLLDLNITPEPFIDVRFNVVNKNVYFKPNHKRLAYYISTETPEHVLELSNNELVFYLFDESDPTLLYDKYSVKLTDLLTHGYVKFKADWLDLMRTKKFKLLASNIGIDYSFSIDEQYVKDHLEYNYVELEELPEIPVLRFAVMGDFVYVESLVKNPINFKMSRDISLYVHKEGEPEVLLRKYIINRNDLANNGKVILGDKNFDCKISVICSDSHINVETTYE